jgi:hypothetical protein
MAALLASGAGATRSRNLETLWVPLARRLDEDRRARPRHAEARAGFIEVLQHLSVKGCLAQADAGARRHRWGIGLAARKRRRTASTTLAGSPFGRGAIAVASCSQ